MACTCDALRRLESDILGTSQQYDVEITLTSFIDAGNHVSWECSIVLAQPTDGPGFGEGIARSIPAAISYAAKDAGVRFSKAQEEEG